MLTYDLQTNASGPVYKILYDLIRQDIIKGKLKAHEKMPSKRTLAKNLGLSTISVENAYELLISEGYLYSIAKKGYYVAEIKALQDGLEIKNLPKKNIQNQTNKLCEKESSNVYFDFSSNMVETSNFPFSVWVSLMRKVISTKEMELLELSPCAGVYELRQAIAEHLQSFRGMIVDPKQIIIGAGTEYLYGLLIKLLGNNKKYCIENPGYKKLLNIYKSNDVNCCFSNMDQNGISIEELRKSKAQIAHISPTHHFPTGITMPVSRRYEILAWANENPEHFIIEDDYDSEFRIKGKPIPPLQSLDAFEKVIYMNTFSKSLTSTIRISYMVLPENLLKKFYENLSFYSCTVSTFEQYTLAAFIKQSYFEKHINRMRLHYIKKRAKLMELINKKLPANTYRILENDSGLHFILELDTKLSDQDFKSCLEKYNVKISSLGDFEMGEARKDTHQFIINYSNIDMNKLEKCLELVSELL